MNSSALTRVEAEAGGSMHLAALVTGARRPRLRPSAVGTELTLGQPRSASAPTFAIDLL